MAITKADRKFEPCLTCEGSAGPDWLNILSDQALHIQCCDPIMYSQKVPACFDCFRVVDLIYILRVSFRDFYLHGYFCGKIIQDCPCPYFLHNVFIFFRMECFEAQRVFQVAESGFLIPNADIFRYML